MDALRETFAKLHCSSFLYVKKASPIFNIMRITYILFQIIRCEAIFKINLLLADRH